MPAPAEIDLDHIRLLSWSTTTSYTPSNIIAYNVALGASGTDLSLVYEGHGDFHALPTFAAIPVISIMGIVTRSMPDFLPNFQPHNHVHGEHYLELRRPFPKEATLHTTAQVVDVVDRKSGVTVCVGITTVDCASGQEICYNEWTSFIMKVPGKGATKKASQRGAMTTSHPTPSRPPDAVVEQQTTPEQAALYRAASGDLNPLHIVPEVAKRAGFPRAILTGTCTMGMGVKHVLDSWADGDVRRFKSVKLRLSKPVYPGEVVRTEMWAENDAQKIMYRQMVGEDRVVIGQAAVELRQPIGGKAVVSLVDEKSQAKL